MALIPRVWPRSCRISLPVSMSHRRMVESYEPVARMLSSICRPSDVISAPDVASCWGYCLQKKQELGRVQEGLRRLTGDSVGMASKDSLLTAAPFPVEADPEPLLVDRFPALEPAVLRGRDRGDRLRSLAHDCGNASPLRPPALFGRGGVTLWGWGFFLGLGWRMRGGGGGKTGPR